MPDGRVVYIHSGYCWSISSSTNQPTYLPSYVYELEWGILCGWGSCLLLVLHHRRSSVVSFRASSVSAIIHIHPVFVLRPSIRPSVHSCFYCCVVVVVFFPTFLMHSGLVCWLVGWVLVLNFDKGNVCIPTHRIYEQP